MTIEPARGGVDWPARPVALGVEDGIDVATLFARASAKSPGPPHDEDAEL